MTCNNNLQETEGGGVKKLEKATITLADCLACSGCITSAETVLIEQQSADQVIIIIMCVIVIPIVVQVYKIFQQKRDCVSEGKESEAPFIVFSLALQPLLSLAHKLGETLSRVVIKMMCVL